MKAKVSVKMLLESVVYTKVMRIEMEKKWTASTYVCGRINRS